jgi:hypothetical protein
MKNILSAGTGSRKVAMFIPVFLVSVAFVWFGKMTSAEWVTLVQWTFSALAVGLTAERFAGQKP